MKLADYLHTLRYVPRLFRKSGTTPLYLIHFVTEQCNARCKHCFGRFYEEGNATKSSQLTLDEIEKMTRTMDPILFLLPTGGEPFLREDLSEIIQAYYRNCRVRNVGMPTNGSLTEVTEKQVRSILASCPGLNLGIDISIDAIGEAHDEIRGFPGLYERAIATFHALSSLAKEYPHFDVCVEMTFQRDNQDQAIEIYRYLVKELKTYNVLVRVIRGSPRDPQAKEIDPGRFRQFCESIEKDLKHRRLQGHRLYPFSALITARDLLGRKLQLKMLEGKKQYISCEAGRLIGVLRSNGDVYPCELRDVCIGNVRGHDYNFKTLWLNEKNLAFSREIQRSRCTCGHECFLSVNLLFHLRWYPSLIRELWGLYWKT